LLHNVFLHWWIGLHLLKSHNQHHKTQTLMLRESRPTPHFLLPSRCYG
jgi:hypothetical protein